MMNGEAKSLSGSLAKEGRHRPGGAGSWTPSVPAQPVRVSPRRHELNEHPVGPPSIWPLPLLSPATGEEPARSASTSSFPSSNGELPAPRPCLGNADTVAAVPRRTKVKLTPPPARWAEEDEDDIRVYVAPPDGLGAFDLGSVPASVTLPKSSRKAAWFASLSSGGVVVALLFAGSFLVGAPNQNQAGQSWPGYRGGQPLLNGERPAGPSGQNGGAAVVSSSTSPSARPTTDGQRPVADAARDTPTATRGDSREDSTASAEGPASAGPSGPNCPTSNQEPQKPPITSAAMQSQPVRFWSQMDAQAMGRNSQSFLDTVPGNPAAAADLTTGPLHNQGPQALAQYYGDVAYFEVKNVYIDQNEGYTVNTVEVAHHDGTKSTERRTLTFGDDSKIKGDGR